MEYVLIETSWNVKKVRKVLHIDTTSRINRNIVECKAKRLSKLVGEGAGINRNIVECKGLYNFSATPCAGRINRNIVECKVVCECLILFFVLPY